MAQRTFSFKQYRVVDLLIFAILLCVFEWLLATLARNWVSTDFVVSVFYAVVAIVIMRWGVFGFIHCLLSGFIFCLANGGDYIQFIGYMVGNLFSLLSILFLKFVGSEKVQKNGFLTALYIIIIFMLVALGRATMLSILKSESFINLLIAILTTEVLSLLLAFIIVFITRKQEGFFEDQKSYLIRTNEQRQKELQQSNFEE